MAEGIVRELESVHVTQEDGKGKKLGIVQPVELAFEKTSVVESGERIVKAKVANLFLCAFALCDVDDGNVNSLVGRGVFRIHGVTEESVEKRTVLFPKRRFGMEKTLTLGECCCALEEDRERVLVQDFRKSFGSRSSRRKSEEAACLSVDVAQADCPGASVHILRNAPKVLFHVGDSRFSQIREKREGFGEIRLAE